MEHSLILFGIIGGAIVIVLILILMEHSLIIFVYGAEEGAKSLNPYSNGTLPDFEGVWLELFFVGVLILILMEHSLMKDAWGSVFKTFLS